MQRKFDNSESLCRYVAERNPDVILAFSLGKDAIAAWLQLRRFFKRVHPYFCWLVPDLSFERDSLKYFEDFFQTQIVTVPHPSVYRMLRNLVFQAPENCRFCEAASLDEPTFDDISESIRIENNLPPLTFTASGVRSADSIMRRTSTKVHGSLNPTRKTFMPIFDWTADDLCREFRAAKIKLPVDYEMFGRSFDGIDVRFLEPIKNRFPEDYQKILEAFPLAELEIFRMQQRRHYNGL